MVHAGIMFDSTYLIESLAQGVTANDLRVGNAKCGYMVFRPSGSANLANGAGTFAKVDRVIVERFALHRLLQLLGRWEPGANAGPPPPPLSGEDQSPIGAQAA